MFVKFHDDLIVNTDKLISVAIETNEPKQIRLLYDGGYFAMLEWKNAADAQKAFNYISKQLMKEETTK